MNSNNIEFRIVQNNDGYSPTYTVRRFFRKENHIGGFAALTGRTLYELKQELEKMQAAFENPVMVMTANGPKNL
jgi:hypothetical protein